MSGTAALIEGRDKMDIMNVYNALDSAMRDTSLPWNAPFVWLEGRTGVGHRKLLAGCVLTALTFIFASGRMIMLVSNLLGFAYPTYATVEFMLRNDEQREVPPTAPTPTTPPGYVPPVPPTTRWLTYWMTFSAVLIVQQLCGDVLQFIPFYFLSKIVFFVWCALPMEANGAAFVHNFVVRGYLKRFFD